MRALIMVALLAAGVGGAAHAQGAQIVSAPVADPRGLTESFFGTLKDGKVAEALALFSRTSSFLANNLASTPDFAKNIQNALNTYGPVESWERIDSTGLGNSVRRDTYLVRHRDFVTRWQIAYLRLAGGWVVVSFKFDDEVPAWFK